MQEQPTKIIELVKSLRDDTTALFRDEIALAKTEIAEKVTVASRNLGYLAAGALVASGALMLVLLGLAAVVRAILLSREVSEPVASVLGLLIVGALVAAISAGMIVKALETLRREPPVPTKTVQTLEEDKNWIQRKVS